MPAPYSMYALNRRKESLLSLHQNTVYRLTCVVCLGQLPSSFFFSNTIVYHEEEYKYGGSTSFSIMTLAISLYSPVHCKAQHPAVSGRGLRVAHKCGS